MPLTDHTESDRSSFTSYTDRIERQLALRTWLAQQQHAWSHFVTIAFNEEITEHSARRLMRRFHQLLDQKLFGRKFYRRPDEARTFFIAIPEIASSLHFHALFRVPAEVTDRFCNESPQILKNVARAASYDVVPIQSLQDCDRIISYITKDAHQDRSFEQFIVSSEFHERRETETATDSRSSEFAFSIR